MNPNVGDVQLNEERRADAYNEASLRKEIRFFPNPPLEAFSFFKCERPSILFFSADRLDHRVLLTSENSLDKDVEVRKDGSLREKRETRGQTWKRGGNGLRLSSAF